MGHGEGEGAGDDGARRRLRGDEGAVLVEAAFVLPILVFLVFAIYAVCTGLNAKTELTGAVREGARAAALTPADSPALRTITDNKVRATITAASPGLRTPISFTVDQYCATNAGGADAKVTATYDVPISVPFLRQTSFHLTSTAVVRCGL